MSEAIETKKRLLFIYNPHSGRGMIRANLPEILDIYSASEYELIVHATQKVGDAYQWARDYARRGACDIIVCAGGDGTLDEVAAGIMKSGHRVPVGIISAGSTNDFGYSLGIPADIIEAAGAVLVSHPYDCDIASFNDRYFTYTAAFGTFADVSYDTPQNIKNALGHAAYILNGMSKLSQLKTYHARVSFGDELIEDDFLIGMVVSSNSVGGFRGITGEGVSLDDGQHELILIRAPKKIGDLSHAVNEVLTRKFEGGKYLIYRRVTEVHFSFDEEVAWSLDGEFSGLNSEIDINVINKGISYMITAEL